jgi:hypothetical protein
MGFSLTVLVVEHSMNEVVYVVVVDPKEPTIVEFPDDAVITHMTLVGEGFFLTDVEVLMRFIYTDGSAGELKAYFTSKGGIAQRRHIDAEDLGEVMYRSVLDGFLKQKIVPRPKKIKRVEIEVKNVVGRPEFRITLYVRFYSNQEKYPFYFITKSEKYPPVEEKEGKIIVKLKVIPGFEW